MENQDLAPIRATVTKLEHRANDVNILDQQGYADAVDLISKLKETGSKITAQKESITKPLNEALKSARAMFAPIEAQFAAAEAIIKGKLLAYSRKVNAEAAAKEAAIAKKVEDGKMKIETAERKIEQVERVEQTTKGRTGEVQIRKIKKVRIVDVDLIPRSYMAPDQVAIRRDALGGVAIPGVEVYEEESIAAGTF